MLIKIKKKYKECPLPIKASFYFLICNILQQSINFLSLPLFTRMLSPSEFGLINIFNSWLYFLSIFVTLNLGAGIFSQGLLDFEKRKNEFISATQGLSTTVCIFWFILYFIFSNKFSEFIGLPNYIIYIMFLNFFLAPSYQYFINDKKFNYNYKIVFTITFFLTIINTLITLIIVYYSKNRGIYKILTNQVINSFIYFFIYLYIFKKGKKFFDKSIWKYLLKFSLPLLPHYLSNIVLAQCDKIMIDHLIGRFSVGIYSIAHTVGLILTILISAVSSTFNPWSIKKFREKKFKDVSDVGSLLLIMIGVINCLIILVAPEIIIIIAPKSYYKAIYIIPGISLSVFYQFFAVFFTNVEFYYKKVKIIAFSSGITAIINIILNFIFIPIYGFIIAGYTTLCSYMIFVYIHYWFTKPYKIYDIKKYVIITSFITIISLFFLYLYNFIILRYFILLIIIFIFLLKIKNFKNTLFYLKGDQQ